MKNVALTPATFKTAEAAIDTKKKRTFSGDKFELQKAANADTRVTGNAFKVLCCILDHVNEKTGIAWPSVGTIAVKTRLPVRVVERALRLLREIGWIASERVYDPRSHKTHNVYRVLTGNMNAIVDEQVALLEASKERREKEREVRALRAKCRGTNPPVAADRSGEQSAATGGSRSATSGGVTRKGEHPNSISASEEKVSVVETEDKASEHRWPDWRDDCHDLAPDHGFDDDPLDEDAWRLRVPEGVRRSTWPQLPWLQGGAT